MRGAREGVEETFHFLAEKSVVADLSGPLIELLPTG